MSHQVIIEPAVFVCCGGSLHSQDIFRMCQQKNPEDRPTFEELSELFEIALAEEEK